MAKNLKRTFSEDEQLQLQKSLDTAARALAGCAPDAGDARSLKVFAKNARDMSMEVCEAARCTLKQLMTELIDAADSEACKKLESSYLPSLRDFASRVCSSSISPYVCVCVTPRRPGEGDLRARDPLRPAGRRSACAAPRPSGSRQGALSPGRPRVGSVHAVLPERGPLPWDRFNVGLPWLL